MHNDILALDFKARFASRGIIVSALIIAAGVLLLLFNMGTLPAEYKPIIFSWQMLIIALGFSYLFSPLTKWLALGIMLLGGILLLPKFEIEGLGEVLKNNTLAILCITAGMVLLSHVLFGHRRHCGRRCRQRHHFLRHRRSRRGILIVDEQNGNCLDYTSVFNNDRYKINSPIFRGGTATCVFSNIELDFSDAHLAEGENNLEVVFAFASGVFYVPAEWNIKICHNKVFGSFEDRRPNAKYCPDSAASTLIITATTAFGGGEIRLRETNGQ